MKSHIQAVLLIAAVAGSAGSAGAQMQLGKLYEDPMNGYSLRPPAEAQRVTEPGADYLARWLPAKIVDEEVPWSLTTSNWQVGSPEASIQTYAKVMMEVLEKQPGTKLAKPQFAKIQGFDVVQVTGVVTGRVAVGAAGGETKLPDLDFYQLVVMLKPAVVKEAEAKADAKSDVAPATQPAATGQSGAPAVPEVVEPARFLEIKFVTETRLRDDARKLWPNILRSLKLSDPTAAIRRHDQAAQRSAELLWPEDPSGVEALIRRAIPAKPQWFLVYQNGKSAGWMRVDGGTGRDVGGKSGFAVYTHAMLQAPGKPLQLVRRSLFTTPDMRTEMWKTLIQTGSGPAADVFLQTVQRTANRIFTVTGVGGKARVTAVPPAVMAVYLPRPLSPVVPAVLDLQTPGEYVFGEYDENEDSFSMRTIQVGGPEPITVGGKTTRAIRLVDRPTPQSEPKTIWVTPEGTLLKSQTADGLVTVAAEEKDVVRVYPKAPALITKLDELDKNRRDEPVLENPNLRKPRRTPR